MKKYNTTLGINENTESVFAYLLLWVGAIILLIMENKNKTVRFHAMQSLIVFLGLHIISMILNFIPIIGFLFSYIIIPIITLILWIVLIYFAYKGEKYKIPIIGYIADDIVSGK